MTSFRIGYRAIPIYSIVVEQENDNDWVFEWHDRGNGVYGIGVF